MIVFVFYHQISNPKIDEREIYNSIDNLKVIDEAGDYRCYWDSTKEKVQIFTKGKKYSDSVRRTYGEVNLYVLADDSCVAESKKVKKVGEGFVKAITNRSYKNMNGYEGYEYYSDELYKKMDKLNDPKLTLDGYVKGKLIGKVVGRINSVVTFTSKFSARITVYCDDKYVKGDKKWLENRKLELNGVRGAVAYIEEKKQENGEWKMTSYILEIIGKAP